MTDEKVLSISKIKRIFHAVNPCESIALISLMNSCPADLALINQESEVGIEDSGTGKGIVGNRHHGMMGSKPEVSRALVR